MIVNPIAGIGGRVGLKGSDGVDIQARALALGAERVSPARAVEALTVIARLRDNVEVFTYPGEMGESECGSAGLEPRVIGSIDRARTTSEDTRRAATDMAGLCVGLLLFAGGDGTARDIYEAIGEDVLVLGIPAGVKIHSAVFAVTPRSAGELAARVLQSDMIEWRLAEVMDIDEEAFRGGVLSAKLYGYMRVPEAGQFIQGGKIANLQTEREALLAIGEEVVAMMDDCDCYYIVGPGTTTAAVMDVLGLKNTLLGVDVVRNKELVASDVGEAQILDLIEDAEAKIVVTTIGGQGHVFGRGNQQISPRVIRSVGKENIIIVATAEKLRSLRGRPMLVDTGDEELNQELRGYYEVVTGYREYAMRKIGY